MRLPSLFDSTDSSNSHYKSLYERAEAEQNYYKSQLFDAWKSLQQQQKGMRRMARRIKRLSNKCAELEHQLNQRNK